MRVIRGAGVDLTMHSSHAEPEGTPVVMLAARMLWDKGVGDFVEAARIVNMGNINARFVLDELYVDSEAVAAHRETRHFRNYLGKINDLAERTSMVLTSVDVI